MLVAFSAALRTISYHLLLLSTEAWPPYCLLCSLSTLTDSLVATVELVLVYYELWKTLDTCLIVDMSEDMSACQ